jgi:hypothetical protein
MTHGRGQRSPPMIKLRVVCVKPDCARTPHNPATPPQKSAALPGGAVLRRRFDHRDELFRRVALAAREGDEFVDFADDGASLWCSGDGDPAAASELEQTLLLEEAQGSEHGVGVDAENGRQIPREGETLAGLGFAVCDRASDLGGDLLVERRGGGRIDPHVSHCAANLSSMNSVKEPARDRGADAPPGTASSEADALFEEARRLRRRRWLIGSSLVAAAAIVSGALVAAFSSGGSGPGGLQRIARGGPQVSLSAMRSEGELAFVSRNDLYLVDGPKGAVHEIAVQSGWTALHPSFSHDGTWVAYETEDQTANASAAGPEVWIARTDGSDRRRIVDADGLFGWSPSADLLAISTDTRARFPGGSTGDVPTRLNLVSPTGARKQLVALNGRGEASVASGFRIWNAVWSPSGNALAVSLVSFTRGSIIRSYPTNGSTPTTWFAINGKQALPGVCASCGGGGTISDLAGWWPKWGIGFWVFSSGMVHNNDSTPIELVHTPGTAPHIIGWTLSDGTTDALAASPTGSLAIVASAQNAGRTYGIGKEVATCNLAHETCRPIPDASTWFGNDPLRCSNPCLPTPRPGKPGSAVSLDPVWSPTQNLLAYVKAPTASYAGNPPLAWYRAHKLYVYNPATRRSSQIAGIDGISVPTWSSDGKNLLYVADDALWLAPATGGKPTEIATPLFAPPEWLNPGLGAISYYGQIDWTGQFTWQSPNHGSSSHP